MRRSIALVLPFLAVPVLLLAQAPPDPRRHQALTRARDGEQSLQAGNFDEAANLFGEALELDPSLSMAHCGLGQAYMGLKQYARATQAFRGCREAMRSLHDLQSRDQARGEQLIQEEIEALRDSISRIDAGGLKDISVFERDRIEKRIADLERRRRVKVGEAFVPPPELSLSLGSAYFRQGLLADAEREYRAAIQARPTFGEAHNNLAAVLLRTGRAAEAAQEVTQAEQGGYAVSAALKADIARAGQAAPAAAASAAPAPPVTTPAASAPVAAPPAAASAPTAAAPAPEAAIRIDHEAVDCAVAGQHPMIRAQVSPVDEVATVRLRFTTERAKGWFSVSMWGAESERKAVLPAPKKGLARFRYQIESLGVSLAKAATPEYVVEVVDDVGACAGRRVADTAVPVASLLVEAPSSGAKQSPLVPAGFSSSRVTGQVGAFDLGSKTALLSGLAVGAGVAVATTQLAGREEFNPAPPPPPPVGNEISFQASSPAPGSTISLAGGELSMTFRVAIPSDIAPGTFRVNLSTTRSFGPNCITLQGSHGGFRAGESQLLVATGPPFTPALDQCGASFTTIEARAFLLDGAGRIVLSTASIAANPLVRYSFVP